MNGLLLLGVTAAAFLAGGFMAFWIWGELHSSARLKAIEVLMGSTKDPPPRQRSTYPFSTRGRPEQALALLTRGCPCSETILGAYGPSLGLSRGEAFELGLHLARKVNMCETCGAVTGAFIILGKCQPAQVPDKGASEKQLAASLREFATQFEARHGTTTCRKFLIQSARKRNPSAVRNGTIIPGLCPRLVRDAGEILEQMLDKGGRSAMAA